MLIKDQAMSALGGRLIEVAVHGSSYLRLAEGWPEAAGLNDGLFFSFSTNERAMINDGIHAKS